MKSQIVGRVGWGAGLFRRVDSTADDIRGRMTGDQSVLSGMRSKSGRRWSRPAVLSHHAAHPFVHYSAPLKKAVQLASAKSPAGCSCGHDSSAVLGLVEKATSAAESSVPATSVRSVSRRAGNYVECVEDIRNLPLAESRPT